MIPKYIYHILKTHKVIQASILIQVEKEDKKKDFKAVIRDVLL